MFAHARIRKATPIPPPKKRKREYGVEDVCFDDSSRREYLTGFHKRKLQRVKLAQEEAARKAREEKIEMRKEIREERKRQVEEHISQVNAALKDHGDAGRIETEAQSSEEQDDAEKWEGFSDASKPDDHQEEYLDEDKFTTVTVESVSVSRGGLFTKDEEDAEAERQHELSLRTAELEKEKIPKPKKRKKKFTYETRYERQLDKKKRKAKMMKGK